MAGFPACFNLHSVLNLKLLLELKQEKFFFLSLGKKSAFRIWASTSINPAVSGNNSFFNALPSFM